MSQEPPPPPIILSLHLNRKTELPLLCVCVCVGRYNKWKGGAIIALSYEAKAAGVRRNMRGEEARRACPGIRLVTVPVRVMHLSSYMHGVCVFDCMFMFVAVGGE